MRVRTSKEYSSAQAQIHRFFSTFKISLLTPTIQQISLKKVLLDWNGKLMSLLSKLKKGMAKLQPLRKRCFC